MKKNPPGTRQEKLSACIDGECSVSEADIKEILDNDELLDKVRQYQLISDCLKRTSTHTAARKMAVFPGTTGAARTTSPGATSPGAGQWLARAAMFLLLPGILVLAWFNFGQFGESGDPGPGEQPVAVAPQPGNSASSEASTVSEATSEAIAEAADGSAAATAATAQQVMVEEDVPGDFRMDYLIYHSAYVSNSDSNGAVLPYVRLAGYRQEN